MRALAAVVEGTALFFEALVVGDSACASADCRER